MRQMKSKKDRARFESLNPVNDTGTEGTTDKVFPGTVLVWVSFFRSLCVTVQCMMTRFLKLELDLVTWMQYLERHTDHPLRSLKVGEG